MTPSLTSTVVGLVVFGLVVSLLRTTFLVVPLDIFLIAWHEAMHAIAAWLTGGTVISVEVRATDGLTRTIGGVFPVVAMAGYVGTAAWGAILLANAHGAARQTILRSTTLILPGVVLVMGGGIGIPLLVIVGFAIVASFLWSRWPYWTTLAMSALFATESWRDVGIYLLGIPGRTDAGILARWMGMPFMTLPVALTMATLSALIWYRAFVHLSRIRREPSLPTPNDVPAVPSSSVEAKTSFDRPFGQGR